MEKIGSIYVRYRECPPTDLTCDIVFNRLHCESEEGMKEREKISGFFEGTGWEEVFSWFQATIFVKEGCDNESLYTDETLKLRGIHASMKKIYPRHLGAAAFLIISFLLRDIYRIFFDPFREYIDINVMQMFLSWTFILSLLVSEPGYYYIWKWRSARSVSRGGKCVSTKPSSYIKNATLIIFAALFVYLLASFSPISVKWRIIILAFILIFALMHIFLYELQLRENEVGISEQKTNAIRAASYVFMLIFAIALIVIGNIL